MSARPDEDTPLGVIKRILKPTERDQFLKDANLGLGNYNKALYYRQIESFRNHLLGEAIFGEGKNVRRAVSDVQYELAREAWENKTAEERDEALLLEEDDPRRRGVREKMSRREWFARRGKKLWDDLLDEGVDALGSYDEKEIIRIENRLNALEERAEIDGEFVDPFGRMILARHEASRSRDAHLVDSVTGRVKEWKGDGKKPKRGIRGRRK